MPSKTENQTPMKSTDKKSAASGSQSVVNPPSASNSPFNAFQSFAEGNVAMSENMFKMSSPSPAPRNSMSMPAPVELSAALDVTRGVMVVDSVSKDWDRKYGYRACSGEYCRSEGGTLPCCFSIACATKTTANMVNHEESKHSRDSREMSTTTIGLKAAWFELSANMSDASALIDVNSKEAIKATPINQEYHTMVCQFCGRSNGVGRDNMELANAVVQSVFPAANAVQCANEISYRLESRHRAEVHSTSSTSRRVKEGTHRTEHSYRSSVGSARTVSAHVPRNSPSSLDCIFGSEWFASPEDRDTIVERIGACYSTTTFIDSMQVSNDQEFIEFVDEVIEEVGSRDNLHPLRNCDKRAIKRAMMMHSPSRR